MVTDYKNCVYNHPAKQKHGKTYVLLLLLFCFSIYLNPFSEHEIKTTHAEHKSEDLQKNESEQEKKYTFYFLLSEETIIPAHEIKVRSREHYFGKGKNRHYMIQTGAFKKISQANKLKDQLKSLGLEAHIKKQIYGNVIWKKVQLGPYSISQVSQIKTKLNNHEVDLIVLETSG